MANKKRPRKPRAAREKTASYKTKTRGGLTRAEAQAIKDFRARLHQILRPDQIRALVLYGSKARGDARSGSDVDLLLVHRELSPEQKETVEDLTVDMYSGKPDIHVLAYSSDEISKDLELGRPLFVNISKDGKLIEGDRIVVNETNKPQVSQEFVESAKKRMHAAQALIESGDYRDSISRSYYAVLDAAAAALIAKGFTPKSHEGSIALFGAHFAKTGLVNKDFASLFNRMSKIRKEADYNRQATFDKSDADYWFKLAKEFVDTIETLLPTLLEEKQ